MTPILGIMASSMQGAVGDYQSIATVTVGGAGSTSIDFTSIAGTYSHLQIRCLARASTGGAVDYHGLRMQLNGDTGTNYRAHYVGGTGAAAYAGASAAAAYIDNATFAAGSANTANVFGVGVIDILNYASANINKTVRSLHGMDSNNTYGAVELSSGLWFGTPAAVTSIKIYASVTIAQYSSFALYGIK